MSSIISNTNLPSSSTEVRWYATYTCANHEKKVCQQLEQRDVESFLPLYETVRRWRDRRIRLQLPLFPGYVFVRLAATDRLRVLEVAGVVRIVGFNGQLAALPSDEIDGLKRGLVHGVRAEPYPFLTVGRRVRVKSGPFAGRQGILLRRKGNLRLVLSVDVIMRSLVIDIDASEVEPIFRSAA
jgi:transcription antitermination factor NusG